MAVKVMGTEALRRIAKELVDAGRKSVTIDRTVRQRTLRKQGYPPNTQKVIQTVPEQAELLRERWALDGGGCPIPFAAGVRDS